MKIPKIPARRRGSTHSDAAKLSCCRCDAGVVLRRFFIYARQVWLLQAEWQANVANALLKPSGKTNVVEHAVTEPVTVQVVHRRDNIRFQKRIQDCNQRSGRDMSPNSSMSDIVQVPGESFSNWRRYFLCNRAVFFCSKRARGCTPQISPP